MLIYKILGSALMVSSGCFLALCGSRYEKRRVAVLDAFLRLMLYIKGQIDCFALPLGEILAKADREALGKGDTFSALVEENRAYLDRESRTLLNHFAAELGATGREDQKRRCDYYISLLTERRGRVSCEAPMRTKVGATLWLCSAVCIAILLW